MENKIFAFDMGKTSIGYCVRNAHDILEANSFIIDKDYAEVISNRDRRRVFRSLEAHKARERYFVKIWTDCNLKPLDKEEPLFKKEFSSKDDNTLYNSCLLRIALIQNKPLADWQIFKALHSALQRRGYDANLPWKSAYDIDDKENEELVKKYTQKEGAELINSDDYKYPCYYEALRLGLWTENNPNQFNRFVSSDCTKVRSTDFVAPRNLVEKELRILWGNAQKQLPQLKKYTTEEFLYGEYKEAYGSYSNPVFQKYMGTERDWQGALGQKIPRFNNRIIAKCKLLPKRNVCKADTLENVSLVLLMKLKNLNITTVAGEKVKLNPIELKEIYNNWLEKVEKREGKLDTTITCDEVAKVIGSKIVDRFPPLKANISGRSSFCRRACQIMTDIILEGELYPENLDISKYIDKEGTPNGITESEIRTMLSKIGDWNNLYIPDNRDENAQDVDSIRQKTDIMIGDITNPVVRNRLQIFRDLIIELGERYGKPDEIIFEFARDSADNSLFGREKALAIELSMKNNEKENLEIKKELEEAQNYSPVNFDKWKLAKRQTCKCVYSGKPIGISDLDKCEIDHIYPRSKGGNDALYNRVLCYREENQKKLDRTPYEWLSHNEEVWAVYVKRLSDIKKSLGNKKFELLTSKPEVCEKLIEGQNALTETRHISKVAQQIAAFVFGWGLQVKDEKRHIFVNTGSSTAAIRRRYGLNAFLGNDKKKNRANDKHHALDAICISYSRDFKYDKDIKKDRIDGFNPLIVKKVIDEIIPYPYTNKKPLKSNIRPEETIYGIRSDGKKALITKRVTISSIEQKDKKIKSIVDEAIKQDLLEKLELKMSSKEWINMLENYIHPKKKTKVKKVLTIVSEGTIEKDSNGRERVGEYVDFGTKGTMHQFKRSKGHKGQILYFDKKGTVKVMPVYSNIKMSDVRNKIIDLGCKLYSGGEMFHSGCLIDVPNSFEATVYYPAIDENGKEKLKPQRETVPEGIFKVRTIKSDGEVKLENSSGNEIVTRATVLANVKFQRHKN